MLIASVTEEGQVKFHQFFIKGDKLFFGWLNVLNGGQPFKQQGPVGLGLFQAMQGIMAVWINAGPEIEVIVFCHFSGKK